MKKRNFCKSIKFSHPLDMSFAQKVHHSLKLWRKRKLIRQKLSQAWPEGRKSFREVYRDMLTLIWKYNCRVKNIMGSYFNEGLHRTSNPLNECNIWVEWTRLRYILDYNTNNEDVIRKVANKLVCKRELVRRGYPTAAYLGMLIMVDEAPMILNEDGNYESLDDCLGRVGAIFVKPDNMLQGIGCAKIQASCKNGVWLYNGVEINALELGKRIRKRGINVDPLAAAATSKNALLVEPLIVNHPELAKFHPASLNTLRIITMRTPSGGVEVCRAIMRFGAEGKTVDNMAAGGVAVPVSAEGILSEFGHRKQINLPPYRAHPDTGVKFKGTVVPYWKESVELCMNIRRNFCPELFVIGFDVAITPTGPLIVEINKNSDFFQRAGAGGTRRYINTWLHPLVKEYLAGNPIPYN